MSKQIVSEIALQNMVQEISSSIPKWVSPYNRGSWYAKTYGFTGATAFIKKEWLDAEGITLADYVQILLDSQSK